MTNQVNRSHPTENGGTTRVRPPRATVDDVRMRGFLARVTVAAARAWVDQQTEAGPAELVPLAKLAGRVLAADVTSAVDVPGFDRSMMDGLAVRAEDTQGATAYNRRALNIVGEVLPGVAGDRPLRSGEAVKIMTGAPLPPGADAVLPIERVELHGEQAYALDEVSPGKHVGHRGEDLARGTVVLPRGRRLRPQDIGVLSSVAVSQATVVRRPRVRIVTTGNELLPAGSPPSGFRFADSNGPMLHALVERDGGEVCNRTIVADQPDGILAAMSEDVDVVLVSGGSSVGQEDHAPALLIRHGELAIHGIAMRPSSPTGMGRLGRRLVFLLPGNPVSCLCAYDFFAGRAIRRMGGLPSDWPYRPLRARLARKLVSMVGRVDYARVRLVGGLVEPLAIGGASSLSSTTRADGFVIVPEDSEGFPAGAESEVWLYD